MKNRIKQFRKLHGLTLKALGDRIGTTPQTIQRLETANMTVSTDWLEKIAAVFGVEPAALLTEQVGRTAPLLGTLGRNGVLRQAAIAAEGRHVSFDVPAEQPVAVELDEAVGPYPRGCTLIGNRLTGADMVNAIGRDAIVRLRGDTIVLRRVVRGSGDTFTLVPLQAGGDICYDVTPEWIARLVMRMEYL
jgi:transcriptional regulator with XRE-family HTH domain